jgi:hypothetical protein
LTHPLCSFCCPCSMGDYISHQIFGVKKLQTLPPDSKFFTKYRGGIESLDAQSVTADPPGSSSGSPSTSQRHFSSSPALPPSLPFLIRWSPNTFPYALEEGLHHCLLWISHGDTSVSDEFLQSAIEQKFPARKFETIFFVNPVENRSVKVRHRERGLLGAGLKSCAFSKCAWADCGFFLWGASCSVRSASTGHFPCARLLARSKRLRGIERKGNVMRRKDSRSRWRIASLMLICAGYRDLLFPTNPNSCS